MFQAKQRHTAFYLLLLGVLSGATANAEGYDDAFEMKNKLKVELQYADYWR